MAMYNTNVEIYYFTYQKPYLIEGAHFTQNGAYSLFQVHGEDIQQDGAFL